MKKITLIITFLIISILGFSSKGNYDETKFRQDVVNYAVSNLGAPYSNDNRMQNGYYDCSSYVGRAVRGAGMSGGVNGNEGSWASTTDSMAGYVKNVPFDQIKPGDTLNFSKGSYRYGHTAIVLENLGNGKFKIAHASSSRGTVIDTIDVRTWRRGTYIGSISATQILMNNGYTPVNQNGQVVTPPAGAPVSEFLNSIQPIFDRSLDIDFNKISNRIATLFIEGGKRILPDLVILLSIIFAYELYFFFYDGFSGANDKFMIAFGRKILKFVFYLAVLQNYFSIVTFVYNFFLGIAEDFLGSVAMMSIFSLEDGSNGINLSVDVFMKSIIEVLKYLSAWGIKLLSPMESLNVLFLTIAVLLFVLVITIRYLLEIFMIKTQLFEVAALSVIFLPFEVFEKTKAIGNSRTLKSLLSGGLLVSGVAIVGTLCYDILKDHIIEEAFFSGDALMLSNVFYYILIMFILFNLLKSVRDMLAYLMR